MISTEQREPLRWSRLRKIRQSPRHYRYQLDRPTDAKESGSALHAMLLGGPPVVPCEIRRDARTQAYKEFLAENEGAIILTATEYAEVRALADAVRAHPDAAMLLDTATERETKIEWTYKGRRCSGTPDLVTPKYVVDVKKCRDCGPWAFGRTAAGYGYHLQVAWYRRALNILRGVELVPAIIACEAGSPYDVAVYEMTPAQVQRAEEEIDRLLDRLAECEREDDWPGKTPFVQALELPEWAAGEDGIEGIGLVVEGEEV